MRSDYDNIIKKWERSLLRKEEIKSYEKIFNNS